MASEPQTGVSDDDLVRRGDVVALIRSTESWDDEGDRLRHVGNGVLMLPSASAPAERLARAAERRRLPLGPGMALAKDQTWTPHPEAAARAKECSDAEAEFAAALAAFRAAPEPAPLQKPAGSCDEAAVRANNPEPVKPEPCPGCHGIGVICANPRCNYMVPCGSICNKCGTITPKCAAPKPEPCRTCGGAGWLWRHEHPEYREIPMEDLHDDTRYACPACRPGGAA